MHNVLATMIRTPTEQPLVQATIVSAVHRSITACGVHLCRHGGQIEFVGRLDMTGHKNHAPNGDHCSLHVVGAGWHTRHVMLV